MLTSLRAWFHGTDRVRDEASNSFALMLIALPVILASFGMGVDLAKNVYVKTSLQNALDTAVVSGATSVYQRGGQFYIDPAAASVTTQQTYALDRRNGPGTRCWGTNAVIVGSGGAHKCWREPAGAPQVGGGGRTLTYTVQERTTNTFLAVIGQTYQDYTLRSTAVVNQHNE